MKIKIIHPTRNRQKQAFETFNEWMLKADNPENIEYVLSIDADDESDYSFFGCTLMIDENKSAIEAINSAANYIEKCSDPNVNHLIVVVSDDFGCPEHWDTELLKFVEDKTAFVLKTNDGLQPTLVTLPIMDRRYYRQFGYIYNPYYAHMFCDQELTAVAIMTERYLKCDLVFPHRHYSIGLSLYDYINAKNDASWGQGEAIFNERLKTNFGIENPAVPYSSIQWK